MPTYDYECSSCAHRFEIFERVHETDPKICPKCGKRRSRRQIGAGAGFIFKGSGFYVTESRASSGTPPDSGSKEAKSSASKARTDGAGKST
ncbi:MAG: zinc ribbon domain-containing protein [Planctomycetes bacterium]|nr:zinc ribbon domain-containing protein [Planctomycetota bacterium]